LFSAGELILKSGYTLSIDTDQLAEHETSRERVVANGSASGLNCSSSTQQAHVLPAFVRKPPHFDAPADGRDSLS